MAGVIINEDNGHFYSSRLPEQMTAEVVRGLIDTYAAGAGTVGVALCVNLRRALFASEAWEPVYHGYDPEGGPDQPFLAGLEPPEREIRHGSQGRLLAHNIWTLKERGIDHLALWLDRCRRHGIEGWLTMRMNDVHYSDNLDHFWHCTLWRTRPDLWRVNYRYDTNWDRAFDYGNEEVREHHMALIRELFERYDMDGLELDWIRSIFHFAPGKEEEGCGILTAFVREVRELTRQWSERRGHPIKLSVRVPECPETGRRLGMDGVAWVREGLVDQVVLSPWLSVIPFDPPVDLWRDHIGDRDIKLAVCLSTSTLPFSAARSRKGWAENTIELLRGAALSAYHKGADRVYLFNYCYYESSAPPHLRQILNELGSAEAIAGKPRRHAVAFQEIAAPGEAEWSVLPVRLDATCGISKPGPTATLCPYIGPAPTGDEKASVILGFDCDEESPEGPGDLDVHVNGVRCEHDPEPALPKGFPPIASPLYALDIPAGALHSGRNAIECRSRSSKGTVVWAEIYVR